MMVCLITPAEAAARLAVSRKTLQRMRKAGELPWHSIKNSIRYNPADIDRIIRCSRMLAEDAPGRIRPPPPSGDVADFETIRRRQ
jgi:excisionase family DNA binding protein